MSIDWRLPENRRESFQRSYTFSLEHRSFPGMVYSMLPAIADAFDLDDDGRAWLVWLNGNTQNVVTSMLLLEAAPTPDRWQDAVDFWNTHFKALEWDTDRRHQKSKFGEATELWVSGWVESPVQNWTTGAWKDVWSYSKSQPYMGRLSAWSMMEYARILLPGVPDMGSWLLDDVSGSRSHRNGLAVVAGYDAWSWDADTPFMLDLVPELEKLADDLLEEAVARNGSYFESPDHGKVWDAHQDVCRLTMESALCTYKSWHKSNRRYPNVYADMMYYRIKKAEARFGRQLGLLWDIRRDTLPGYLRLEDNPNDPGLSPVKQNWYRETGEIILLHHTFDDMEPSGFDKAVAEHTFGLRKEPQYV
jgi:hypothetical protein